MGAMQVASKLTLVLILVRPTSLSQELLPNARHKLIQTVVWRLRGHYSTMRIVHVVISVAPAQTAVLNGSSLDGLGIALSRLLLRELFLRGLEEVAKGRLAQRVWWLKDSARGSVLRRNE